MQDVSIPGLRQSDVLDPARACALQLTLGDSPNIGAGDPLPPFFEQLYFWETRPPAELGRDGHPRTGRGLIPDMGLPRRMWAGGRLAFHAPLRAGYPAEKLGFVEASSRKQGRTGPLAFVRLRYEFRQEGRLCRTEWRNLVYREDPAPGQPKPSPQSAPSAEGTAVAVTFNTTTLFRYSALTFNGHRIHYDLDYARDVEGYDGLVVHGPLLAQHLMLLAEAELGSLTSFRFRATSPLMHFETATFCRRGKSLWVRGPDGRQCMQAEAEISSEVRG